MTTHQLIILTNCTERKRGSDQAIHLSSLVGPIKERARRWTRRLEHFSGDRVPAMDLYQGDHWTAVLGLVRRAERAGWDTELWVASAGYGLIPSHAAVLPYAATFAGGHVDSVGAGSGLGAKEAAKRWWAAMQGWQGPATGTPRTLADLAKRHPKASWLLVMSPTYLNAISEDLVEARHHLKFPDRLILVSGKPGPSEESLIPHWVPALEAGRGVLGGGCTSLNARVGSFLISHFPCDQWSAKAIQPEMNLWAASLIPTDRPDRRRLTDAKVITFIRRALRKNPDASHSNLLRALRDQGLACEQKRFRGLFKSLKDSA